MEVKKCDRCGKYYELYRPKYVLMGYKEPVRNLPNTLPTPPTLYYIDLCPECTRQLTNWMDTGKKIKEILRRIQM